MCRRIKNPKSKAEGERGYNEEVDGDDVTDMRLEEGAPRRGGPRRGASHALGDGELCDLITEEAEFGLDPAPAPGRVLSGHLADQGLEIFRQTRPSCRTGLPPPEKTEPLAVPSDQRLGLDHNQSVAPVQPPAHETHQPPGGILGPVRFGLALLIQGKLLA